MFGGLYPITPPLVKLVTMLIIYKAVTTGSVVIRWIIGYIPYPFVITELNFYGKL
jgi:hypothetical protein